MSEAIPTDEQVAELSGAMTELRRVEAFADLADEQLAWLAAQATFHDIEPGITVAMEGEPFDVMIAIIQGELRSKRERKEQTAADSWLYVWKAGELTGKLPFSRMTVAPVTTRAVVPTRYASFPVSTFPEMMARIPVLTERFVRVLLDRARLHVRDEEQHQSLLALGKIAAGLAHELYNPTAAVLRGARELRQRFNDSRRSSINLAHHNVHDDALRVLAALDQQKQKDTTRVLDPIARSEQLEQLGEWLDDRQVAGAWSAAESFLDAGIQVAQLEQLAATLPDQALNDALTWLDTVLAADGLLQDVENAALRVAGLVDAVKSYSYLDRAPDAIETDIHAALDDTLKILTHKLHDKNISVTRDYDPELPRVTVHPGEMNQVWTNLLDNAIDALPDGGQITVRTACEPAFVRVEICDNGPGIPKENQSRIWEPFFTTKDVGKGTGLGLDIVQRIVVRRHQGEIRVESVPGDTCFQVLLPRNPAR